MADPEQSSHGHPEGVPVARPDPVAAPSLSAGEVDPRLASVLARSQQRGLLGPGAIEIHVANARAFATAILTEGAAWPDRLLDLGSGGGVPGLVLAAEHPSGEVLLLDAARRRTDVLDAAVAELGMGGRVRVLHGRAEELARDPALRRSVEVVTSRSFGRPAVTAECAAGFLTGPGARLLVSEPPRPEPGRWPAQGLELLGLVTGPRLEAAGTTIQCLEVADPCPDRFPRRAGIPDRRPLF